LEDFLDKCNSEEVSFDIIEIIFELISKVQNTLPTNRIIVLAIIVLSKLSKICLNEISISIPANQLNCLSLLYKILRMRTIT
jgi:hypothetical protein